MPLEDGKSDISAANMIKMGDDQGFSCSLGSEGKGEKGAVAGAS